MNTTVKAGDAWWTHPRKKGEPVRVALGTMNFGKATPEPESLRILARAFERGVDLVDTANVYAGGASERIVGKSLKGRKEAIGVATKVGLSPKSGKAEGLSRTAVLAAIDGSLERLGRGAVDLYYLHAPDPKTPIEETLDAIAEIAQAGKVHALGVSNYASWQIVDIDHASSARGIARPVASQVIYNLLIRQLDIEYRGFTRAHPIHTTIYNPLAGGFLSGKHARSGDTIPGSRFEKNAMYLNRYFSDRFFDLVARYEVYAGEHGMTLLELAYRFCASCPFVDSVLIGPRTLEQVDAALDALAKPLEADLVQDIDAIAQAFAGTDASYAR